MTPAEKEALLLATRFTFRRLAYVAAAVIAATLIYLLRGVLVPLFLAFLLAYALDPFVDRAERWKVPRPMAAVLIMAGLLALASAVLVVAIPYCADEFSDAVAALPDQLQALRTRVEPWLWERFHVSIPHSWADLAAGFGGELKHRVPEVLVGVVPALFGTFNLVVVTAGVLIIPVFALYLLADFDTIVARMRVLVPRRYAITVFDIADEVHRTLGRYWRGQLSASLLLAGIYALGLWSLDLRLAVPIGILTGLLAFVPYVGFGIGFTLAILMAVLDWHGTGTLVGVCTVMLLGQVLDGLLITPRVVGGSVGLKPIEVLLTMMGGATLFGFLGVLLALPLGAVVKILVIRATRAYLQSRYYRDVPPPATPTPLPSRQTYRPPTPPASVAAPASVAPPPES